MKEVQLKSIKWKISKICSLTHYYFSIQKTPEFLWTFTSIMGNVNPVKSFPHSEVSWNTSHNFAPLSSGYFHFIFAKPNPRRLNIF